jgi:hypothetical protein
MSFPSLNAELAVFDFAGKVVIGGQRLAALMDLNDRTVA